MAEKKKKEEAPPLSWAPTPSRFQKKEQEAVSLSLPGLRRLREDFQSPSLGILFHSHSHSRSRSRFRFRFRWHSSLKTQDQSNPPPPLLRALWEVFEPIAFSSVSSFYGTEACVKRIRKKMERRARLAGERRGRRTHVQAGRDHTSRQSKPQNTHTSRQSEPQNTHSRCDGNTSSWDPPADSLTTKTGKTRSEKVARGYLVPLILICFLDVLCLYTHEKKGGGRGGQTCHRMPCPHSPQSQNQGENTTGDADQTRFAVVWSSGSGFARPPNNPPIPPSPAQQRENRVSPPSQITRAREAKTRTRHRGGWERRNEPGTMQQRKAKKKKDGQGQTRSSFVFSSWEAGFGNPATNTHTSRQSEPQNSLRRGSGNPCEPELEVPATRRTDQERRGVRVDRRPCPPAGDLPT